jgi:hypothetical protein
VVPDGIQLEHKFGAVTGKPMWRVVGFNMPYEGSPEGAVKLYEQQKACDSVLNHQLAAAGFIPHGGVSLASRRQTTQSRRCWGLSV